MDYLGVYKPAVMELAKKKHIKYDPVIYRWACIKCFKKFTQPKETKGHGFYICPDCYSTEIVEIQCAHCDFFIERGVACENGIIAKDPFSHPLRSGCDEWAWKIRHKDKTEVR